MATVSIARRYARALLESEAGSGNLARISDQLWVLGTAVKASPELQQIFGNPSFSHAQRAAVTEGLLKELGEPSPSLAGVVRLLVERDRGLLLPDVARIFRDMVDTREGRVRGEITSATPLSADTLKHLEEALERAVQRDVVLQTKVDPTILGGVSARVGWLELDGSIRTQLESLRSALKQA